MIYAVTML